MTTTTAPGNLALDKQFEAARTAIVGRRLTDLPSVRLRGIEEQLGEEQSELVAKLESTGKEADEALAAHDWSRFDGLRARAIEMSTRYEELRDLIRRVSNARQERHLEEQIEQRFGSRRRVVAYDVFIMALIVVVVTMLIGQEIVPVTERTAIIMDLVDIGACCIFLTDFFWRMRLAENKKWFWKRYWLDFVTSIPIPTSILRAGRVVRFARLARMVRLVRLLRIVRAILFFWRGMDKLAATLDIKMMRRSLGILVTVLVLGGFAIWYVEGGAGAEGAEDLGQGLWWSFTTVVTGGFGDIRNPTTWTGRLLTMGLIIAGMVVVGIFTATLTSVLVREEDTTAAVLALDEKITSELHDIRVQLTRIAEAAPAASADIEPSSDAPSSDAPGDPSPPE